MDSKQQIEHIAKLCHSINKIYCETIGDHSQVAWGEAPEHVRQSVRNGVQYQIDNPEATPRQSHENWLRFKEAEGGWSYGPVKDLDNRVHPCFLPYDELPEAQRRKDEFFTTIVQHLLNRV